MFKGDIKNANESQKIKCVFVARLFYSPGQRDAELSRTGYVRENKNYRYLLLFIPDKSQVPVAIQTPEDYFIFLNRIDNPHAIHWYKTLFTASQDIAEWGFKSYEVLDLTGHADLEAAFGHLRKELTDRKISIKPVRRFIDDLVSGERGLPIKRSRVLSI